MNDWYPLEGDPAPGDPGQIDFGVTTLLRSEQAVRDVDDALTRIARGTEDAEWRGESAEAMRKALNDFRYDLEPIADSFGDVAASMKRYARDLEELQDRARQALKRAQLADAKAQAAEGQQASAAAELRRQQQALANSKRAQSNHASNSAAQSATDPSAAQANAQEADRLARQTRNVDRARQSAQDQVNRIQQDLTDARAALDSARNDARRIHEDWDQVSKRTAGYVEDALASVLKNKSNLEKLAKKVTDEIGDIARFLADPLHNISVLRKWIDRLHTLLSYLAFAVAVAIAVVLVVGAGPLGPLLAVAFGVALASLALSTAKLQMDTLLFATGYEEDGEVVVTKGDLIDDAVDVGFDVVSVVTAGRASSAFAAGKAPALGPFKSFTGKYVYNVGKEVGKKTLEDVGSEVIKEDLKKPVIVTVKPAAPLRVKHCVFVPRDYVIKPHGRTDIPKFTPTEPILPSGPRPSGRPHVLPVVGPVDVDRAGTGTGGGGGSW